uniref:Uncharacterized protein n=1 Tax=Siphoviridae sp. ctEJG5 TaxID=2827814 RepID=A0A8S5RXW9_9CAUD|nr:MAG TPA: hypothetical protein [Siphoviridae sp. ctEJG5]
MYRDYKIIGINFMERKEVIPFVYASNLNRKYERKLLRFAVKHR